MRRSRNALIGVLALGTVLVAAPSAMAQGDVDNTSAVQGGISPNLQDSTKPGEATLFAQVQTADTSGAGPIGAGPFSLVSKAPEKVQVHFDNDLVFNPTPTKFPTCGGQGGSDIDNTTSAQALAECGDANVGSGFAEAVVPTGLGPPAPPTTRLELTVSTFNGPVTVPGGPCTPPGDATGGPEGCEYVGGNPQVILHAYQPDIPFTTTVGGEVLNSDETGADYGKMLNVTDAPDTAGDAGALVLFGSTVGSDETKLVVRKDGTRNEVTKLKEYEYVKATCQDDGPGAGGLEYDFRGEWVYDDGTTDTDTFKQKCANETSTPAP